MFAVLCILFLKCPHLATYLVHHFGDEVISVFLFCDFINIRVFVDFVKFIFEDILVYILDSKDLISIRI